MEKTMKLESPYPHEERIARKLAKGQHDNIYLWDDNMKNELMMECSSVYVEVVIWQTDGYHGRFYTQIHDAFPLVDSFPRNWQVDIKFLFGENE
jgi:hypothetical protein